MRLTAHALLLMIMSFAVPALSAESWRAGYELTLTAGSDTSSIQTRSTFSGDEPVIHDLGNYRVVLFFKETSESGYSMKVVVRESGSDSIRSDILEHVVQGSYNGIAEFSHQRQDVRIEGVVAVNPLR